LGTFSYISIAKMDEFLEKYSIMSIFGNKLKKIALPLIPGFVSGSITDMGLSEYNITGSRVCLPPIYDDEGLVKKKLKRVINTSKRGGTDVLIIDPEVEPYFMGCETDMKISKGLLYSPLMLIDAVKTVSALMGIDFKRCNICIADAASPLGTNITELLINEAAYMTLCTNQKEKVMKNLNKCIMNSGLSPAVVSNYKKAMSSCDILFYTGAADLNNITSFVSKKMLIANVAQTKVKIERDLLMIDDVLLHGQNEPTVNGTIKDNDRFLTSRVWEGALLTLLNFDSKLFSTKKAYEVLNLAKRLDIRVKAIIRDSKVLDRETIYSYI